MNEELVKSLTSLIDETIAEIEDLKKSRFAASEIKLAGPGEDGIKGHNANGKLDKEEAEKKEDDDKDEDDKKDKKEMDKGEGQNRQADPNGGHHVAKADDEKKDDGDKDDEKKKKDDEKKKEMDKAEGQNRQADPNGGHHQMDKGEDKMGMPVKKSADESNTLMKSYIDSKVAPLESKLAGILDLVKKIAEQPVASKAATAKNFAILQKSEGEGKSVLSKAQVANKLFELKKSGTPVDSADITAAELGSSDLQTIVTKYGLQ